MSPLPALSFCELETDREMQLEGPECVRHPEEERSGFELNFAMGCEDEREMFNVFSLKLKSANGIEPGSQKVWISASAKAKCILYGEMINISEFNDGE